MLNPQYIDIHAHILPGLDDGPADWQQSVELCRHLFEDGIGAVIAAPHQLGRYGNQGRCGDIRRLSQTLGDLLRQHKIPLTIYPGAEVRLDERIESLLAEDQILTLADGRKYLLLELLPDVAVDARHLVATLCIQGITPVIAHIERYPYIVRDTESALPLYEAGAVFQVTASSLVGGFGRAVHDVAWWFILSGAALVVATDAHNTAGRAPQMHSAFDLLSSQLSFESAYLLCHENPQRILDGRPLKPLPAMNSQKTTQRP